MNIEEYSKVAPQYFDDEAPTLLTEILKKNSFETILDCGCGDGSLLYSIIKHKLGKKAKINAIDLSRERVKVAQGVSKKIRVKVDSAETLKTVNPDSIDLFISEQVIEHVNDRKMVDAISRVTKPGAIVYLSTVFKKWYGWYFYKNDTGWVLDPTHLREYTSDNQLLKLFRRDFHLLVNNKTLQWFPIADFILKRFGVVNRSRDNLIWKVFRSLRIPISGYYLWEMVFVRK